MKDNLQPKLDMNGEKKIRYRKQCNICHREYLTYAKYKLFCSDCRGTSEVYRYNEWMQEVGTPFSFA